MGIGVLDGGAWKGGKKGSKGNCGGKTAKRGKSVKNDKGTGGTRLSKGKQQGKSQMLKGSCHHCGKYGRKESECWQRDEQVKEVAGDVGWIFSIGEFGLQGDAMEFMVDSGAFRSVCPVTRPRAMSS